MGFTYKQAIVLRKDLNLSRGKAVAQGCHASLDAYDKADNKIRAAWKAEGAKKVVLAVENEKELVDLFMDAKGQNLPASLITDAGLTEIPPGTKTTIAIGPAEESKIDKLTSSLPLLS
jgi:PTH2 family peptidyl-tRNA hydrolase